MKAGIAAEFETPELLIDCVRELRRLGFEAVDTFTPWSIQELDDVLVLPKSRVNVATLVGGLTGAAVAYVIMWWTNAVNYPLIVGSRPPHAAPAFIPITFETMVLFAGFSALISCFAFCGLPALWHPLFEIDGFESASVDRFWVAVDARDSKYDAQRIAEVLRRAGALKTAGFGRGGG